MTEQALDGLVVLEFAAFAAGPCVGKYMANHGALVIKIESTQRLDGFRVHYPPYKDHKPGVNRSAAFAFTNDSVKSLGLNLKAPAAVDLALKLAAKADVVIENFTPGTIARLGLGYEQLSKVNPRLVMLSTCNMGQTGPRAQHPGFGSQLTSLSGFTNLVGEPGGDPVLVYGPYIDFIAVGFGYISVMAALQQRHRTGRGQYIDLSQYEGGLHFVAPALLEYQISGKSPDREGNRHPYAAPHGVYRCAPDDKGDDNWCAISVFDDAEWARLVTAMGNPAWARSPLFATVLSRKQNETQLDTLMSNWTGTVSSEDVMNRLQRGGVHAAKVSRMSDLFSDPQLAHRRHWREVEQSEVGRHHAQMSAFTLSQTPCSDPEPEPRLFEHTEKLLGELLGIGQSEVARLEAQGAIEVEENAVKAD